MATQSISPNASVQKDALNLARIGVRNLLTEAPAFQAMPPDKQLEIAHNTVQLASYLAAPDGLAGNQLATALDTAGSAPNADDVRKISQGQFTAGAAREGAAVAG